MIINVIAEDRVNLSMTRGDTEFLTIGHYQSLEGVETLKPFVTGDTVTLTIREYVGSSDVILSKVVTAFVDGKARFEFNPVDTKDLEFARYAYDVEVKKADQSITTIFKPSIFEITGEVTTNA